ncbi:MAG: hypothetical protein IJW29_02555 [Clostridia bacterium]|nr:hypothetical protein [Clostridia bacterium]
MFIVSEPNYATTNWYRSCVDALKNQARKKRVQLTFADSAEAVAGEKSVFVLGASVAWLGQTVAALQEMGAHPILLNELPDYPFFGKYSCVKTDYNRFMSMLSAHFLQGGRRRTAFYGMNPASFSDISRKNAFENCFSDGVVFENRGSLADCFARFYDVHEKEHFDAVICANDFAAVSLFNRLRLCGASADGICIAVHSNAQILTRFPQILGVTVDYSSVAAAAFEIADCLAANPSFAGMRVTVEPRTAFDGVAASLPVAPHADAPADPIYTDAEILELMRIERLLSACDETDLHILRHLAENCNSIGESAFLSDNGVKYRIKKMKKLCAVASKSEIPVLLSKYGVEV